MFGKEGEIGYETWVMTRYSDRICSLWWKPNGKKGTSIFWSSVSLIFFIIFLGSCWVCWQGRKMKSAADLTRRLMKAETDVQPEALKGRRNLWPFCYMTSLSLSFRSGSLVQTSLAAWGKRVLTFLFRFLGSNYSLLFFGLHSGKPRRFVWHPSYYTGKFWRFVSWKLEFFFWIYKGRMLIFY